MEDNGIDFLEGYIGIAESILNWDGDSMDEIGSYFFKGCAGEFDTEVNVFMEGFNLN